jgi:hypothetical protein
LTRSQGEAFDLAEAAVAVKFEQISRWIAKIEQRGLVIARPAMDRHVAAGEPGLSQSKICRLYVKSVMWILGVPSSPSCRLFRKTDDHAGQYYFGEARCIMIKLAAKHLDVKSLGFVEITARQAYMMKIAELWSGGDCARRRFFHISSPFG